MIRLVQKGGMDRCRLPLRRSWRRAAIVSTMAFCGYMSGVPPLTGEFGVSTADAKSYYTRKRVNGRWITGTFPKGLAKLKRTYARLDPEPEDVVPLPPARDASFGIRPTMPLRDPVETTAALSPALDATLATPAPTDDRLARLRDALQAKATNLVTATVDALSIPPAVPPVPTPVIVPAAAPLSVFPTAPLPAKASAQLEPRSVSFDFQTGVKTTVFENSIVREPFDVGAMKQFATPKR